MSDSELLAVLVVGGLALAFLVIILFSDDD